MSGNPKKKLIKTTILILATAAVMLGLPVLTVTATSPDIGMAVMLLLFLVVDPIFSILLGVFCGEDIRFYWFVPIVNTAVFLCSFFFVFSFEPIILCYGGVYLLIAYIAASVRHLIKP